MDGSAPDPFVLVERIRDVIVAISALECRIQAISSA